MKMSDAGAQTFVEAPRAVQIPAALPPRPAAPAERLLSLDTYRGLIMVSLAFVGFGLAGTARNFPQSPAWQAIGYQFDHVDWVGCTFWDLIQPSFMFMVGVAMAYSYAKRRALGHSYPRMLAHAGIRSLLLIALGILMMSNWQTSTRWHFITVLPQIGLGYTFLFLLWGRPAWAQGLAAVVVLLSTWAKSLGEAWSPTVEATLIGLVLWLICCWMYRNRVFVRI